MEYNFGTLDLGTYFFRPAAGEARALHHHAGRRHLAAALGRRARELVHRARVGPVGRQRRELRARGRPRALVPVDARPGHDAHVAIRRGPRDAPGVVPVPGRPGRAGCSRRPARRGLGPEPGRHREGVGRRAAAGWARRGRRHDHHTTTTTTTRTTSTSTGARSRRASSTRTSGPTTTPTTGAPDAPGPRASRCRRPSCPRCRSAAARAAAGTATGCDDPLMVHGVNGYSAALFLHILLFVYWLGGDLGVYYSSRYILKPELAPESRAVAAKIMHGVDLAPRICLILFLPSGVTLMAYGPLGDDFFVQGWLLVAMWVAFLAWLVVAVVDYRGGNTRFGRRLQVADLLVRYVLVVVLLAVAAYTLLATDPFGVDTNPKWLGAKVAAYALCILCRRAHPSRAESRSDRRSDSSSPPDRPRRSSRPSRPRSVAASRTSTPSGDSWWSPRRWAWSSRARPRSERRGDDRAERARTSAIASAHDSGTTHGRGDARGHPAPRAGRRAEGDGDDQADPAPTSAAPSPTEESPTTASAAPAADPPPDGKPFGPACGRFASPSGRPVDQIAEMPTTLFVLGQSELRDAFGKMMQVGLGQRKDVTFFLPTNKAINAVPFDVRGEIVTEPGQGPELLRPPRRRGPPGAVPARRRAPDAERRRPDRHARRPGLRRGAAGRAHPVRQHRDGRSADLRRRPGDHLLTEPSGSARQPTSDPPWTCSDDGLRPSADQRPSVDLLGRRAPPVSRPAPCEARRSPPRRG